MDLSLSADQALIRETARRFSDEEIKPIAAELDKTCRFPTEICRRMSELGFLGGNVPAGYGGAGIDYVSYAGTVMEVSRGCASCGCILASHNSLYCYPVLTYGTEEQKQRFLVPAAKGEKLGCFGLTEPTAGSDAGNQRTTAVPDGDHWVINGNKIFITNGTVASLGVILAVTDPDKAAKGLSCFIVDMEGCAGLRRRPMDNKLGIHATGTAELVFDRVRVPKQNLLGTRGAGLKQMLTTLDGGRIGIASQAAGIGRAVLEEAIAYCQTREQFGKPIAALQANQFKLANMAADLDAAELLILRAAWLVDQKKPYQKEAAMAKMFASDAAMRAAVEGVQILGGYGYFDDHAMERHLRDIKITQIYEGTNEVMRLVIARNLLV